MKLEKDEIIENMILKDDRFAKLKTDLEEKIKELTSLKNDLSKVKQSNKSIREDQAELMKRIKAKVNKKL